VKCDLPRRKRWKRQERLAVKRMRLFAKRRRLVVSLKMRMLARAALKRC
jgi:hypothetical protein